MFKKFFLNIIYMDHDTLKQNLLDLKKARKSLKQELIKVELYASLLKTNKEIAKVVKQLCEK